MISTQCNHIVCHGFALEEFYLSLIARYGFFQAGKLSTVCLKTVSNRKCLFRFSSNHHYIDVLFSEMYCDVTTN